MLTLLGSNVERRERGSIALALRPGSDDWYLVEHAATWATWLNVRLDLFTVVECPGQSSGGVDFSVTEMWWHSRLRAETRGWLTRILHSIPPHIRGRCDVLIGTPGAAILEHAKTHALLLLGRGRSRGIRRVVQGSVVERVIRATGVPTMVVGGRRPQTNLTIHLPIKVIDPRLEAAKWVASNLPGATVTAVHAISGAVHMQRNTATSTAAEVLDSVVSPALPGAARTVLVDPAERSIAEIIGREAQRTGVDLVAIPRSNRRVPAQWLFGSVTRSLIRDSLCSVLVVPSSP